MIHRLTISIIGLIVILLIPGNTNAYQVTFQPRATITEEYTDNVDLSESDEESDFITTIQPGFTLAAIGQTRALDFSYDPAYSWYANNAEYDTLRHSANLNAYSLLSRNARIEISDSFLYTEEPLDSLDAIETEGDRTGREPYYNNVANLALTNRFGSASEITLAYQYAVLENEDEANQQEDSQEHTPFLSWEYALSERVVNSVNLAFTRGEFDVADDFERYFANFQLRWQATRNVATGVSYEHTALYFDQNEDENYHIDYPALISFTKPAKILISRFQSGIYGSNGQKRTMKKGFCLPVKLSSPGPFDADL